MCASQGGWVAVGILRLLEYLIERARALFSGAEEFWGRGIATAVVCAFVRWAFQEHTRIERLGAVVTSGNGASQRVLKKVGFVHEGTLRKHVWKNGQFRDQFMFGLLREDIKD